MTEILKEEGNLLSVERKHSVGLYMLILVVVFVVISFGVRQYNQELVHNRSIECATLAGNAREEKKEQMQKVGQDKTDFYEDQFTYSKTLKTCLYFKSQTPFVNKKDTLEIATKEIIDLLTNQKIASFIDVIDYADHPNLNESAKTPVCISYMKDKYPCETKEDFFRIKEILFQ